MAEALKKLYFLLKINLFWDNNIPPIDFDINKPLPENPNEVNLVAARLYMRAAYAGSQYVEAFEDWQKLQLIR